MGTRPVDMIIPIYSQALAFWTTIAALWTSLIIFRHFFAVGFFLKCDGFCVVLPGRP